MLPTDGSLDHRHKGIAGDGPKIDYNDLINTPTTLTSKFGGIGTNGALSISSGTTTVDCGAARYKELNYTNLSIIGTGALQFTNPHSQGTVIVLKVQGNLTITTSVTGIDASGMGGAAGASVGGGSKNGLDGTLGSTYLIKTNLGTGATGVLGPGTVGIGGVIPTFFLQQLYNPTKYFDAFVGAGGGSGDCVGAAANSGAGGIGGGALIIEVGGALNFTTANGISVAGKAGLNGSSSGNAAAGGGGGGGGGYCRILYNSLTANTGTIAAGGGAGGTCSVTGGFAGLIDGGGGGGAMTAGTNGSSNNVNGATNGGPGGSGASSVVQNVEYT